MLKTINQQKQRSKFYIFLRGHRSIVYYGPWLAATAHDKKNQKSAYRGKPLKTMSLKQCSKYCRDNNLKEETPFIDLVAQEQSTIKLKVYDVVGDEFGCENYTSKPKNCSLNKANFDKIDKATNEAEFIKKIKNIEGSIQQADHDGKSLAHIAASRGYTEALKQLANKGIELDMQDKQGFTALHVAILCNKQNVIRFLLSKNVNCTKTIPSHHPIHAYRHLSPPQFLNVISRNISDEKQQQYIDLSYEFPFAKWDGVVMHLGLKSGRLQITELDFTQKKRHVTTSTLSQAFRSKYPDAFLPSGKLKAGLALRHVQAVASIIDGIKKDWVNRDIAGIRKELCSHTRFDRDFRKISAANIVDYIADLYNDKVKDENNLFIGNETENAAFGWLITRIESLKKSISRNKQFKQDPTKIPEQFQAIKIPREYQAVFIRHEFYKGLSYIRIETNPNPHAMFRFDKMSQLDDLLNRANYDDPDFACLSPKFDVTKKKTFSALGFFAPSKTEEKTKTSEPPLKKRKTLAAYRTYKLS